MERENQGKNVLDFLRVLLYKSGNYISKTKCKRFYEVIPKFRLTLDFFL